MTSATPPDPGEVRPIGRTDRRWMVAPILVVVGLAVALAKPWGDGEDRGELTRSSPPTAAEAAAASPASPTPATVLPRVITGRTLPAAAEVVRSIDLDAVPWANELAADAGGAWAWSDTGAVLRAGAATETVTWTDLGSTGDGGSNSNGSRGIALAWSQIWVSDPGHRGLARIDPETESVVERIQLWPADDTAASGSVAGGVTPDRWASAAGFAVDGDSIFVPSLGGALWRVDTTSARSPGWISLDHPSGVAVGFGSVWVVTCCGAHSDARTYTIVRLEQETGGVQASITLPVPESGADGRPVVRVGLDSVWVGLADPPLVVRIDPATSSIRSTVPTELPVSDLAVGGDGSLWIAESETWYRYGAVMSDRCDGRLVRLDPALESPVAATTITCPMSVALHGDDVWVGTAGTEPRSTGYVPPRLVHMRIVDPPG